MKRTHSVIIALLLLTLSLSSAQTQVSIAPALMNFQGRLAKPDGTPVADGTYSIRFSLWNALSAGTETWNQTVASVAVKNGTFAVQLSGFPTTAFHGNQWLEIKIGANTPLTPRQQLVSVPYAMKANSVPDGSIGAAQLATDFASLLKVSGGVLGSDGTSVALNNKLLKLRDLGDPNHGLGFFTSYGGSPLDGPALFGYSGGTLAAQGQRVLTWTNQGRVGIGTATPGMKLDVSGTENIGIRYLRTDARDARISVGDPTKTWSLSTGWATAGDLSIIEEGTSGNRFYIQKATGNVGIGTSTPASKLDVNGTAQMTGFKLSTGAGANKVLTSDAAGNGTWATLQGESPSGAAGGDLSGTYPDPIIAANAITTGKLAAGAVTGDKIASATIASSKLVAPLQEVLALLSIGSDSTLKGGVGTNARPVSVAVSGSNAYVVNFDGGSLQIVDVSNPASPSVRSTLSGQLNLPNSVAVSGNYAYVAEYGADRLRVIDVSNPASPTLRGFAPVDNNPSSLSAPYAVAVSGQYVYLLNFAAGNLQVYNVSDPDQPTRIRVVGTGANPRSIALSGNYAYVAAGDNTLAVYNLSDPTNPTLTGSVATDSGAKFVAVSGNTAYVVNSASNTLQAFDVSNPANPVFAGRVTTDSEPTSVAVSGNTAYVVNSTSNSLQVFNVSTPSSLTLIGSSTTGTAPKFITVSGNTAYVANYTGNTLQLFGLGQAGLEVTGNLFVSGDINASGNVRANGILLTSDARYKQNIVSFDNALATILNLRGVTYEWNRNDWREHNFPAGRQIGFIAQEVEKVLPELVMTSTDGYKSVAYANVVPVLVEALKTQQKQIEALQAKNARIGKVEAENAELKARLEALELAVQRLTAQPK